LNRIYTQLYDTPCGRLLLGSFRGKLCLCDWYYRQNRSAIDRRTAGILDATLMSGDSQVLRDTRRQLEEYFFSRRKIFDIPILLTGTDFQKRVWDELCTIGYGLTASYQQVAEKIGNKKAVRAVANANGANGLSILVPCHRIIGSTGKLVGYAGGLAAKEKLLMLEQNHPW